MAPSRIDENTLIESPQGLMRLFRLRELDESLASISPDDDVALREIRLRSGHRLVGSSNHRVLACGPQGLFWRKLLEVQLGDSVAVKYGSTLWATEPARFDDFLPRPAHGSQKKIRLPASMDCSLAFFLGAYAAEGHTNASTHTIVLTNADLEVLDRLQEIARNTFGLYGRIGRPLGKCPALIISSKTLVEFLTYLGCGSRASAKRIPNAVLVSPRECILAFLEGLSLDAYVTTGNSQKWAICLDSPDLLDELQAVLTNLGFIHSRIGKYNSKYNKTYDEVYTSGSAARAFLDLVPFPERAKRLRASAFRASFAHSTADTIPWASGPTLYELLPRGLGGRAGAGSSVRRRFAYLLDPRTKNVSWESLRRLATAALLPEWLMLIVRQNIHFSPVQQVTHLRANGRAVLTLPRNRTLVGNGIVMRSPGGAPETFSLGHLGDLSRPCRSTAALQASFKG